MKIFVICLLIIGISTVPNCAYVNNNNICVSCSLGYQLVYQRCDICSTGFILTANSCVNATTFSRPNTTTTTTATTTTGFQGYGTTQTQTASGTGSAVSSTSTTSSSGSASTSSSPTVVVQSSTTSQPTSSSTSSTGTVTSSGTNSTMIFDISNTGVMYFLQLFGLASQIPSNCQSFTPNFTCTVCVSGYVLLSNNVCYLYTNTNTNTNSGGSSTITTTTATGSSDPYCQVLTPGSNVCQQCYYGYYYNFTVQKCTTVNPLCQTWNSQNVCLSCYSGYLITSAGTCVITGSGSTININSGSTNTNSGSTSANSNVNSGSTTTGSSTSDPNCQLSTIGSSICQQCYYGYYFNTAVQKCSTVNALCQTWNNQNLCLSCYIGYTLTATGTCISSSSSSSANGNSGNSGVSGTVLISSDLNCQIPVAGSSVCQQCYYSFYYNPSTQKCQTVNPLCRTSNNQNVCLSCYDGYNLISGSCLMSNTPIVAYSGSDLPAVMDPNCNLYSNKVCVKCATRTYLAANGSCLQIDPNCQNWISSGACTQCYIGYVISNVNFCSIINPSVLSTQLKSSLNTDANCLKSTSVGVCTQCIFRYVLNSNSQCMKVSDLCQQWSNTTALCTKCYGGYSLNNGACTVSN